MTTPRTPSSRPVAPFRMPKALLTPLCALLILAGCTNLAPSLVKTETAYWAKTIKGAGIKAD